MKDVYIDVLLEVPVKELAALQDPTRELWEAMRHKADVMCAESGARLRTDGVVEVQIREGQHPVLGDVTLFASRWPVVAPDRLEVQ